MLKRFGHVNVEHGCSGIGIPNIYEYLRDAQEKNATDEAVVIVHAVLAINTVRGRGSRRSPLAGGADGADGCHRAG